MGWRAEPTLKVAFSTAPTCEALLEIAPNAGIPNTGFFESPFTYTVRYTSPASLAPTAAFVDVDGVPYAMSSNGTTYAQRIGYLPFPNRSTALTRLTDILDYGSLDRQSPRAPGRILHLHGVSCPIAWFMRCLLRGPCVLRCVACAWFRSQPEITLASRTTVGGQQ